MLKRCTLLLLLLAAPLSWSDTQDLALLDANTSSTVNPVSVRQHVAELMGVVGLSDQARHVSQAVLNAQQASLGHQYRVVNRVAALWSPQRVQQYWLDAAPNLSEQQALQLQQQLQRLPWQQAKQRELRAIEQQNSAEYEQYVQRLRQQNPPADRLALIDALNEAMHFSQLMIRTRASVYQQLQQELPDWQAPEQWQLGVRQQVREFLLFTHRRTPNEQLQGLVELYRQPLLQQWVQRFVQRLPEVNG